MDYETRCRRLADQVAAGREVRWDRGVDALRGAADEIHTLRAKVARDQALRAEFDALARTTLKCAAVMMVVYIATELLVLWAQ